MVIKQKTSKSFGNENNKESNDKSLGHLEIWESNISLNEFIDFHQAHNLNKLHRIWHLDSKS